MYGLNFISYYIEIVHYTLTNHNYNPNKDYGLCCFG